MLTYRFIRRYMETKSHKS